MDICYEMRPRYDEKYDLVRLYKIKDCYVEYITTVATKSEALAAIENLNREVIALP